MTTEAGTVNPSGDLTRSTTVAVALREAAVSLFLPLPKPWTTRSIR